MKTCISLKNKNRDALPEHFRDDDVRFSETLVTHFLEKFTQPDDLVLDPFAGFGTVLLVAEKMGHTPLGIEYDAARVDYIQSRLKHKEQIIHGDSRCLSEYDLPPIDFSITSPPYMGKDDFENPFTAYTTPGKGYQSYLDDIQQIYAQIAQLMKPNAYAVVEVANIKQGEHVTTLAWDVGKVIANLLHFYGETIIDWDAYGYGYTHSYCLLFRKMA